MKSILLKEELQRISEIMNISPKLIIEGITPSKAAEEFLGKLLVFFVIAEYTLV